MPLGSAGKRVVDAAFAFEALSDFECARGGASESRLILGAVLKPVPSPAAEVLATATRRLRCSEILE
jgi:hypothetical protein